MIAKTKDFTTIKKEGRISLNGYVDFETKEIRFKIEEKNKSYGEADNLGAAISIFDKVVSKIQ